MVFLRALLLTNSDIEKGDDSETDNAVTVTKSRLLAGSAVSLENECRAWRVLAAGVECVAVVCCRSVLQSCVAGVCCRSVLQSCVAVVCCRSVLQECVAVVCCRKYRSCVLQ